MNYELFVQLYEESADYDSIDMYIAERGWQEWMEQFRNADQVASMLKAIYYFATHSTLEIRERRGVSRAGFSRSYKIPLRTVEAWELGQNKISEYDKMFISYTFFINDLLEKKYES